MSPSNVDLTTLKKRHAAAIKLLSSALATHTSKADCDKAVADLALDLINILAPVELTAVDEFMLLEETR